VFCFGVLVWGGCGGGVWGFLHGEQRSRVGLFLVTPYQEFGTGSTKRDIPFLHPQLEGGRNKIDFSFFSVLLPEMTKHG